MILQLDVVRLFKNVCVVHIFFFLLDVLITTNNRSYYVAGMKLFFLFLQNAVFDTVIHSQLVAVSYGFLMRVENGCNWLIMFEVLIVLWF